MEAESWKLMSLKQRWSYLEKGVHYQEIWSFIMTDKN